MRLYNLGTLHDLPECEGEGREEQQGVVAKEIADVPRSEAHVAEGEDD